MTLNAQNLAYLKLLLAIRQNDFKTLKAILSSHPELLHYNSNGNSLLHQSIVLNNVKLLEFLYEQGANLNIKNHLGYTPLIQAILFNKASTVNWLLEQGCNPMMSDLQGNTAYHHAMNNYNPKIIRLLKLYKANHNSPNHYGKTPYQYRNKPNSVSKEDNSDAMPFTLKIVFGMIVLGMLLPTVVSILMAGIFVLYKVSLLFATEYNRVAKETPYISNKQDIQYAQEHQPNEHIDRVWPHLNPRHRSKPRV